jgi:hypothetical protein
VSGIELRFDESAFNRWVNDPAGPVARHLDRLGEVGEREARRTAPMSPAGSGGRPAGWLRDHIGRRRGRDARSVYVDIFCDARTADGHDYGLDVELGTKPHVIRSKGNYPLRNKRTGQVFGRVVHHPGTRSQPFLRAALEYLRGVTR